MAGLRLEDFDVAPVRRSDTVGAAPDFAPATSPAVDPPDPAAAPATMSEADRSAAYEEGYQAGWDDAVRMQSEEQSRIGAEFARNLQELSFTFHEARAHVIQSMEPLLNELLNTVLPELVAETFALTIQEELRPLIADSADGPVELVVGPGGRALLEGQVAELASAAIRLTEEPTLAEGQAYLRIGKTERQVDLSGALDRIRASVAALYELNERTLKHG